MTKSKSILDLKIPGKTKKEQFAHLYNLGYNQQYICKAITISKSKYCDLERELEGNANAYLNHLGKIGYISKMQEQLQEIDHDIQIQSGIRDLAVKSLERNPDDPKMIFAANQANSIVNTMKIKTFDLLSKAPLAASWNKHMREYGKGMSDDSGKPHSNNKYGMSVLPEGLIN